MTPRNGPAEKLDLMRDEFRRIVAEVEPLRFEGATADQIRRLVVGLCERAVSGIEQHTPVIRQRDAAIRARRDAENALHDAQQENAELRKKADLWDRQMAYEDRRNELDAEFRSLPLEEQRRYKWWAGWAEEKERRKKAGERAA